MTSTKKTETASRSESMDNDDYHFGMKVCVLGDSGVGKSTLVSAFLDQSGIKQPVDYSRLGGVGTHTLEKGGYLYRMNIWDAPGAPRFMKLTGRLCAGCTGAIFVFDVTDMSSFNRIEDWFREVERTGSVDKILVGNKADEPSPRVVSVEQATSLAQKYNIPYVETNALRRAGVTDVFDVLYKTIIAQIPSPAEPSLLLRRSIRIGQKLANDPRYRQALFSSAVEGLTESPDWV